MGADAGVAQLRRLCQVLFQGDIVGLASQGEFRQQQWIDAAVGESPFRRFAGGGYRCGLRRRAGGGDRRLAGAGQQQRTGHADGKKAEHNGLQRESSSKMARMMT